MPKRSRDYRSWLLNQLRDPRVAASYLTAGSGDSPEMFLTALRNVAESHRMSKIAEEAGVSRESLYRTLSEEGNPRFDTLTSVLRVLGLRIAVVAEGHLLPLMEDPFFKEAANITTTVRPRTTLPIPEKPRNTSEMDQLSKLLLGRQPSEGQAIPLPPFVPQETSGYATLSS